MTAHLARTKIPGLLTVDSAIVAKVCAEGANVRIAPNGLRRLNMSYSICPLSSKRTVEEKNLMSLNCDVD